MITKQCQLYNLLTNILTKYGSKLTKSVITLSFNDRYIKDSPYFLYIALDQLSSIG